MHIICIGVNTTAFGRKLTLFSTIPLSRFSLKMSRFFLGISRWKKMHSIRSVQRQMLTHYSDDSATAFQYSAKLIRSAKLSNSVCFGLFVPRRARVKDIPDYRSSGNIGVLASRRCTTVPVAPPGGEKKYELQLFTLFRQLCPTFSLADVDTGYAYALCRPGQ